MGDPIEGYRTDLDQIQKFLSQGGLFSFSPEERQKLLGDSQKFLQKIDRLGESFLTVGFLGGTGVGKSSLMNALAGREIASTSHRRPHTEKVLIYRHETASLPAALKQTAAPWSEILHNADPVRQIILCDLPDFDSLVGEHRRHVLNFLEHLDLLIWVTSPEKYADGRFYDFLKDVPKARENFYFVLNKVDLFFGEEGTEKGYDQLDRVTRKFQEHLSDKGVTRPLLFSVSVTDAAASPSPSPWNQFPAFRHQIFQQRDLKEILVIKAANLDVEIQQFLLILEKEVLYLNAFRQALGEMVLELKSAKGEWLQASRKTLDLWVENDVKPAALSWLSDPSCLVGPGYGLGLLMLDWQKRISGCSTPDAIQASFREDGSLAPLRRQLQRWEDHMANHLLRRGLPAGFIQELEARIRSVGGWEGWVVRLSDHIQMRFTALENRKCLGFRVRQYLVYLLVLTGFLISLGGRTAWRELLSNPDWSRWVNLVAGMAETIFGPVGLAALGSFLLLQFFLAFRFYGHYKKSLQRRAQKFIDSLKSEVQRLREDELDRIVNGLNDFDQDLQGQITRVAVLQKRQ